MDLPELPLLGQERMSAGYWPPTIQLMEQYSCMKRAGIADTSASHVWQPSEPAPLQDDLTAGQRDNIRVLEQCVDPHIKGRYDVSLVGLAYPQLIAAQSGSIRAFVAANPSSLKPEDRKSGQVFINPIVTPITSAGQSTGIEMCGTGLGVAVWVTRWNKVEVRADNLEVPVIREGAGARIVQHENGHLDGESCIDLGLEQGSALFFVPGELHRIFFDDFVNPGRSLDEWPKFLEEQWVAWKRHRYSLDDFLRYL